MAYSMSDNEKGETTKDTSTKLRLDEPIEENGNDIKADKTEEELSESSSEDPPGWYTQINQVNNTPKEELEKRLNGAEKGKTVELTNNTEAASETRNTGEDGGELSHSREEGEKDEDSNEEEEHDGKKSNTSRKTLRTIFRIRTLRTKIAEELVGMLNRLEKGKTADSNKTARAILNTHEDCGQ